MQIVFAHCGPLQLAVGMHGLNTCTSDGVYCEDVYVCTEHFELVFHTSEPALAPATGKCKMAYINDVILARHGVSVE